MAATFAAGAAFGAAAAFAGAAFADTAADLAATIASMTKLNRTASEALQGMQEKAGASPIHAVTDVTGFGLLGHAREMALGDSQRSIEAVSLEIDHSAIS